MPVDRKQPLTDTSNLKISSAQVFANSIEYYKLVCKQPGPISDRDYRSKHFTIRYQIFILVQVSICPSIILFFFGGGGVG